MTGLVDPVSAAPGLPTIDRRPLDTWDPDLPTGISVLDELISDAILQIGTAEDTPQNRVGQLRRMHRSLSDLATEAERSLGWFEA